MRLDQEAPCERCGQMKPLHQNHTHTDCIRFLTWRVGALEGQREAARHLLAELHSKWLSDEGTANLALLDHVLSTNVGPR